MTKELSKNAVALKPVLDSYFQGMNPSVNAVAEFTGWGWHRANNTLKELGYR